MTDIAVIGLDLAKSVFQIHAVNLQGLPVLKRQLRRAELLKFFQKLPPCLIGMEACGSAHYWAREFKALGHTVRLMPPNYVKPYLKRGKTDARDAEAICEAVTRPTMQFVPVKSVEQQSVLMLHSSRDLLVKQKTMLINALRGHLSEIGLIAPKGVVGAKSLGGLVHENQDSWPNEIRTVAHAFLDQLRMIQTQIEKLDDRILQWHRNNENSMRLATVPGIGPIVASAIAASVPDPKLFRSGRHFSAWLGLTPRVHGSGGKDTLGRITKAGNGYIRRLLVVGVTALLRIDRKKTPSHLWGQMLREKKPGRVVSVALANKTARIAWALMSRAETYRGTSAVPYAVC